MYLRLVHGFILHNTEHKGFATAETDCVQNCDRIQQYDSTEGLPPVVSLALIIVDYRTLTVLTWRCKHIICNLYENKGILGETTGRGT